MGDVQVLWSKRKGLSLLSCLMHENVKLLWGVFKQSPLDTNKSRTTVAVYQCKSTFANQCIWFNYRHHAISHLTCALGSKWKWNVFQWNTFFFINSHSYQSKLLVLWNTSYQNDQLYFRWFIFWISQNVYLIFIHFTKVLYYFKNLFYIYHQHLEIGV